MGQYYYVVNTDKREFLHPHKFQDGLKLMEFGQSAGGTLTGLTILLADGNGRGGGDIHTDDTEIVGRWAGDRIVIAGDYADGGNFLPEDATEEQIMAVACECCTEGYQTRDRVNLQAFAGVHFRDISDDVMAVLKGAGEDRSSFNG